MRDSGLSTTVGGAAKVGGIEKRVTSKKPIASEPGKGHELAPWSH